MKESFERGYAEMEAVDFSFDRFPQLEMERFRLRQLGPDDAEAVFAYLSDAEVMKYRTVGTMTTLEAAREWIKKKETEFEEGRIIRWAIARKEDDRLIGTVLYHHIETLHRRAEIGYDLAREYWGQGVVTEVLRKVIEFGFESMELNRLEAQLVSTNIGSRRVLEKNGFAVEGTLKQYWVKDGEFWDALVMGLVKEQYVQGLNQQNRP